MLLLCSVQYTVHRLDCSVLRNRIAQIIFLHVCFVFCVILFSGGGGGGGGAAAVEEKEEEEEEEADIGGGMDMFGGDGGDGGDY